MKEKKEVIECYCNDGKPLKFITVFKKGRHLYAQQGRRILVFRTLDPGKSEQNAIIFIRNNLLEIPGLNFWQYMISPRSRVKFSICTHCKIPLKSSDLEYCRKRLEPYLDLCPQCTQLEIERRLQLQAKNEKNCQEWVHKKQMRNQGLRVACNANNPKRRKNA